MKEMMNTTCTYINEAREQDGIDYAIEIIFEKVRTNDWTICNREHV